MEVGEVVVCFTPDGHSQCCKCCFVVSEPNRMWILNIPVKEVHLLLCMMPWCLSLGSFTGLSSVAVNGVAEEVETPLTGLAPSVSASIALSSKSATILYSGSFVLLILEQRASTIRKEGNLEAAVNFVSLTLQRQRRCFFQERWRCGSEIGSMLNTCVGELQARRNTKRAVTCS